mmetsp:Transcript_65843/g.157351  ORF Transcript_65843/g.157351 Transcript_65843/m.157351 type:complete len:404 (+) Transcript_65843:72-1283(+)|eukprot:CAMPEP_0178404898 /NCGR_PEP_ID=MMETSP0689_2-20121128/18124_1 /TAXON_ID=160604 /ORGANISM="Amphidinium massartii, Strain CS-259" /LENGTH=403 /DNA_ID=CAMNT_0020025903 /DNA_START=72 /DNA_END=1283 /DNA_ORIENTATION=+
MGKETEENASDDKEVTTLEATEGETSKLISPTLKGAKAVVLGKGDIEMSAPSKDLDAKAADSKDEKEEKEEEASEMAMAMRLAFAFLGLQASYLTWGYMQERVMTKQYGVGDDAETFPSANFCVISNRCLAIVIGLGVTMFRHGGINFAGAPLTSFAPCAFSNSMSSFGQYEALKFVSFPLQTLAKSTKIIPVMIMGKVLNKRTYPWVEYAEAAMISVGVNIFMMSEKGDHKDETTTQVKGIALLVLYVVSDSFTSQWQSRVYKDYPKVDQFQMMCAVNFWAIIFSFAQWVLMGEVPATLAFLAKYPSSIVDNLIISVTSATGQLFIFYTIKTFGPVVFTIIMTTRQIFSLFLSMFLFGHSTAPAGAGGILMVFATLFYQVHRKRSAKKAGGKGGGGGGGGGA